MNKFSTPILRIGMGLVVLWFGYQQLSDALPWIGYLPSWTSALPISQITFVHLNGWFELTLSLLLLCGFYTRAVALLLALHIANIAFIVGYNAIGVRNFGLSVALFSLFFSVPDEWSCDMLFERRTNEPPTSKLVGIPS